MRKERSKTPGIFTQAWVIPLPHLRMWWKITPFPFPQAIPPPLSQSEVHRSAKKWHVGTLQLGPRSYSQGGQGLHPSPGARQGCWGCRRSPWRPQRAEGCLGGEAMPPGTSSRVGETDSLRSAAAAGNHPPGKRSREGRGKAREQPVGQILHQGKAGCLSPPKPEPWVCLLRGHPMSTPPPVPCSAKPFPSPIPSPGRGNGAALCTRCRCQARPVAVAYGT